MSMAYQQFAPAVQPLRTLVLSHMQHSSQQCSSQQSSSLLTVVADRRCLKPVMRIPTSSGEPCTIQQRICAATRP